MGLTCCGTRSGSEPLLYAGLYKANCNDRLTARQIANLKRSERQELICSVCEKIIADQFTIEESERFVSRVEIVSDLNRRDIKCFNIVLLGGCLAITGLTTFAAISFSS